MNSSMRSMETLAREDDIKRREKEQPYTEVKPGEKVSKPNPNLLPWGPIRDAIALLTEQAVKHGDTSRTPGYMQMEDSEREEEYARKAMRHMIADFSGRTVDPETGKLHLLHAMTDLCIALSGVDTAKERYKGPGRDSLFCSTCGAEIPDGGHVWTDTNDPTPLGVCVDCHIAEESEG